MRAELARRRVSGRELAESLGWSRSAAARRLSGEKPFDINELQQVADLLGIPVSVLIAVGPVPATDAALTPVAS